MNRYHFELVEHINLDDLSSSGCDINEAFVGDTRGILLDSDLVGLVDFSINDDSRSMYIGMIEIFDKGRGIGTEFIKWLFITYRLAEIYGEIMIDSDMIAYSFWKSLGSQIELNEDEALEQITDVYFHLYRDSLL